MAVNPGNNNPGQSNVNIIIQARDAASNNIKAVGVAFQGLRKDSLDAAQNLEVVGQSVDNVAKFTEDLRDRLVETGVAIKAFSSLAIAQLFVLSNAVASTFATIDQIVNSQSGQLVIQYFQKISEETLAQIQPLSKIVSSALNNTGSVIEGLASPAKVGGQKFVEGFRAGVFEKLEPLIDEIDEAILGVIEYSEKVGKNFKSFFETGSNITSFASGVKEPLEIFEKLEHSAGLLKVGIAQITEKVEFFTSTFAVLKNFVTNGPFEQLIQQSIQLQQQINSTQTSLAGVSRVIKYGVEIKDPEQAIRSLTDPVQAALSKLRQESLEISGVTSSQLVESFQTVTQLIGKVGGGLDDSVRLTKSFAAGLGTLGIPLWQAKTEITDILNGSINVNTTLARTIGLTNEQINLYKSQGNLIDKLVERFAAFGAGNKLAAQSFSGLTSNIQEVLENINLSFGDKLLNAQLKNISGIYNYLKDNQSTIEQYFSGIADNLVSIFNDASTAIQHIFQVIGPGLASVPSLLFNFLAKTVHDFAESVEVAIAVLKPFVDVLTALAPIIVNYGGHVLALYIQFQTLSVGVSILTSSFETLAHVFPVVGELLFFISGRTNSVLQTFVSLTGIVGNGASAFLVLGKYMNEIPGAAGVLQQSLASIGFGPLASVFGNLIPGVAGFGIQLIGLTKAFPGLNAIFDNILAETPGVVTGLAGMARSSTLLAGSGLDVFLDELAVKLTTAGTATELMALADEKLAIATELAVTQFRNFAVNLAVTGATLFVAFELFDQYVLKNQELLDTIGKIGEGIKILGQGLLSLFSNPIVQATLAVAALTFAISSGLIPAILGLIATQMASWATGFAEALGRVDVVLKALNFTTITTEATQAALGFESLALFFTQGAAASEAFLVANNITILGLGGLKLAVEEAIISFELFIGDVYAGILVLGQGLYLNLLLVIIQMYAMAESIIANSKAMLAELIPATRRAIAALFAMGLAADGVTFSFKILLANILKTALAAGAEFATQVIAGGRALLALATGAGSAAQAVAVFGTALNTALAPIVALLAPLIAVGGAIAAFGLIGYTQALADSTLSAEALTQATDEVATSTLEFGKKAKIVSDIQAEADKKGVALTKEQYETNKKLLEQAEGKKTALKEQIETLKKAKEEAVGDENKNNIQNQIDELDKLLKSIEKVTGNVKIKPKDLEDLGSVFDQLAVKAQGALDALNSPSGDKDIFKKKEEELIEVTKQQVKLGQITEAEAARRLSLIVANTNTEADIQTKAQEGITQIFKEESEKRIALLQSEESIISGELAAGTLNLQENAKQIANTLNIVNQQRLEDEDDNHKVRLKQIDKQYDEERVQTESFIAEKERLASQKKGTTEGDQALKDAQEGKDGLLNIEKERNNAILQENVSHGSRQLAIGKEITKNQQELQASAAELAKQVATGTISEELAAQRQITIAKKAELEARKENQDKAYQENKESIDKEFNLSIDRLNKEITAKTEAANKLPANSKERKQAEAELAALGDKAVVINKAYKDSLIAAQITYATETNKINTEILKNDADSVKKDNDIRIAELDRSQKKALDTVQSAENERNRQVFELQKQGLLSQAEIEEKKANNTLETVAKQLAIEKENLKQLEALPPPKGQKEREELEAKIRAARLKTQSLVQQSLQDEYKAYEDHINVVKDGFQRDADLRSAQQEEDRRAGKTYQAQIDEENAIAKVKSLEAQLELETRDTTKRAALQGQLEKAKTDAQKAGIAHRLADLEDEQTGENAKLQKQYNEGKLVETQLGVFHAQQKVKQLEEDLKLESNNVDKRNKLQYDLEKAKTELIQASVAKRKEELETENQQYKNQLDEQNQKLKQQSDLYELLDKALQQRNKLLEASKSLSDAASNYVTSEFEVLGKIEQSEYRKRQLAEVTAAIKLQSLQQQQAFERESLENQIKQNALSLEREAIQNRINQSQKLSAIAQDQADIEIAKADPRSASAAGQAKIRALELKQQADTEELRNLIGQGGLIAIQQQQQAQFAEAQRRQLEFKQQSQELQAKAEIVNSAPPGRKGALRRELEQEIAENFGVGSFKQLVDSGLATTRAIERKNFNGYIPAPDILGAINPALGDYQRYLGGGGYGALIAQTQNEFTSKFGSTANIQGLDVVNPNAPLLQLPEEVRGIKPLPSQQESAISKIIDSNFSRGAITLPSPTERGSIFGDAATVFTKTGLTFERSIDRLIKYLDDQSSTSKKTSNYNISVLTQKSELSASGVTDNSPNLENVLTYAKQLAGAN